jgi:hypothetical protein
VRVTWGPLVEWNARGGLDVVAYYVYSRTPEAAYGPPAVVYPMDPYSPNETVSAPPPPPQRDGPPTRTLARMRRAPPLRARADAGRGRARGGGGPMGRGASAGLGVWCGAGRYGVGMTGGCETEARAVVALTRPCVLRGGPGRCWS